MSNKPLKSLGERVNFAPNEKDEKKILWLVNKLEFGLSETVRKAIHFYYFAVKSGKYQKFMDELITLLSGAFLFECTPEGCEYWDMLDDNIR